MHSEEEVRAVFDVIGEMDDDPSPKAPGATGNPIWDWRGDTFKYGYLMGRLEALGWVLGDPIAGVKINHDFESYELERRSNTIRIPPPEGEGPKDKPR